MTATRRLAAILAADVAGYSRLMGAEAKPASSNRRQAAEITRSAGRPTADLGR